MCETDYINIEAAEESIAYNTFETAIIFDLSGQEIFRVIDEQQHVIFSSEEKEQLLGMIVTHNHPYKLNPGGSENSSLMSLDDIVLAHECYIHELRTVHGSYVHSFSWSANADIMQLESLCSSLKSLMAKTKLNMQKAKKQKKSVLQAYQEGTRKIIRFMEDSQGKYQYNYKLRRRK